MYLLNREINNFQRQLWITWPTLVSWSENWSWKRYTAKSLQKTDNTTRKSRFSIKYFFSKCDKIRSFLRIWSHLLKKSLLDFLYTFCAVNDFCGGLTIHENVILEYLELRPLFTSLHRVLIIFCNYVLRAIQQTNNFSLILTKLFIKFQ